MQIAKLFASLGFKIDTADLSRFEAILSKAQGEMSQFAQATQRASTKLRIMESRFKKTSDSLNSSNVAKAADRVAKAVDKYVKNAKEIVDIDGKVDRVFKDTGVRLDLLSNKLDGGTSAWNRYEQQVKEATARMREFTAAARERQSVNPPRGTGAGSGSNQGGGGGRGSGGRGNNGYDDEGGLSGMLLGGQKFGKAFVGQMALGGALGSGYIVKEIVQTGREVQKMEQMLLQASKSSADFANNLVFTRDSANALAVDFTEFGTAYSKILNATERSMLSQQQKQDVVFGFAKYMRTINASSADQAGVFRQLGQMFNTGRIQQDEINSMADRGIALNKFLRMAAESIGISSDAYTKLQEAGKADPVKLIPIVSKMLAEAADNNGAFSKSLTTSLAKQQAFTNAMKDFAATMLKSGIDVGLANMFTALEKIVVLLTPFLSGVFIALGGLFSLIKLLFSFDWQTYAIAAGVALAVIVAGFYSIGGAALVAEVAVYSLGVAMKALRGAIPLVALAGMMYFLGEYRKWQKEQESGMQTYSWIDLMNAKMQLFFAESAGGWIEFKLATLEAIEATKELFSLKPEKAVKFIENYGDDIARNPINPLSPMTGAIYDFIQAIKEDREFVKNQSKPTNLEVKILHTYPDGRVKVEYVTPMVTP